MDNLDLLKELELTELHSHAGSSVSPTMLWEMAHNQGIKLATKDYWQFEDLVTIRDKKPYEEYLRMHDMTELIQSSPEAMMLAMETAVSGAYRKNKITTLELRFNPILRNRQGERDLDHIIVFSLQGMERASLKYPVRVGVILMMDRRFNLRENTAVVNKAIKYRDRGVVGIDLAGPIKRTKASRGFQLNDIVPIVRQAKAAGLGVTIHTGEATGLEEMWQVLRELEPDRIGHGIVCVKSKKMMTYLREKEIVLETCPTSNLNTGVVKDFNQLKRIYRTLKENRVLFTINTDGPEMQKISLRGEYQMLMDRKILTMEDLFEANKVAREASFIK